MIWLFAVLIVLVMGGVALVASGRGAPLAEVYDDRPDALVPASGDLGARDLRAVRFSMAFRGYRMSEVDALLDRLAQELERDHVVEVSETAVGEEDEAAGGPDAPRGDWHAP